MKEKQEFKFDYLVKEALEYAYRIEKTGEIPICVIGIFFFNERRSVSNNTEYFDIVNCDHLQEYASKILENPYKLGYNPEKFIFLGYSNKDEVKAQAYAIELIYNGKKHDWNPDIKQ